MKHRKRTTPPWVRRGWKSSKQTVQVHSAKNNSFPVNDQYAVWVLTTRYRLSIASANVIVGIGGRS